MDSRNPSWILCVFETAPGMVVTPLQAVHLADFISTSDMRKTSSGTVRGSESFV